VEEGTLRYRYNSELVDRETDCSHKISLFLRSKMLLSPFGFSLAFSKYHLNYSSSRKIPSNKNATGRLPLEACPLGQRDFNTPASFYYSFPRISRVALLYAPNLLAFILPLGVARLVSNCARFSHPPTHWHAKTCHEPGRGPSEFPQLP